MGDAKHLEHQTRRMLFGITPQGNSCLHISAAHGHEQFCKDAVALDPSLLEAVNAEGETPLLTAVRYGHVSLARVLVDLCRNHESRNTAMRAQDDAGCNVLHHAIRSGHREFALELIAAEPALSRAVNQYNESPLFIAAARDFTDVCDKLLKIHDSAHSGHCNNNALHAAVNNGNSDAPYSPCWTGYTVLHQAVLSVQPEFVEFIIGTPQLRKVVNMRDPHGSTALHNEVSMLLLQANPKDAGYIHNVYMYARNIVTDASRKDAKSLTQTYTSNTSLVAILIATITFAAAFTLPGGYSSDAGSEGLPIMARKSAFQAFLISDTLAMCSSLSVAFICIIARWGDFEFLLYYRSVTKKLMWFAYMATTTAFATGLYTVVAPRLQWLAVAICVLSVFLPVFTYLLGKWPILKLRYRLGRTFKSEFLDMV
ncbi:hypothetical protein EJB05_30035, partial [Eragrostis curvula]